MKIYWNEMPDETCLAIDGKGIGHKKSNIIEASKVKDWHIIYRSNHREKRLDMMVSQYFRRPSEEDQFVEVKELA